MLTAAISELHPPQCHNSVVTTAWQLVFLLAALSLLVVGARGIRPCSLAFGINQFNPVNESGKRTVRSFFNWYCFSFTFAVILLVTFINYARTKNWAIGLAIPAFLMFISCALFFWGSRFYVKV
jgi:amino acid transporter